MNDMPLFDDTDGFVNRPASKERAIRESRDGTRSQRHKKILKYLDNWGEGGATWRQMGEHLGLHHGQISGALSKLHQDGEVFALRIQRDRCHPYVHAKFRNLYDEHERFDQPVRTNRSVRALALERLFVAVDEFMEDPSGYIAHPHHWNAIYNAWKAIKEEE